MLVLIVKFNVATESHPFALVSVAVYVPEVVYVIEFAAHVYELQVMIDSDPDVLLLIVKFNVATESHPLAVVKFAVYVPEVVYVIKFADHV